ncbi:hypothetical protein J7E73_31970 [Paenibacillus albidus]|uniref:hypothetical protein n=1 Tax=Paenibacillus albidus TaxID=2041023 RepID=UPI001BECDBD0|nr:hypothetical protein [Paenibacillus albidus]MBT2293630.1 hypothetical protein [Paenibacillus albidus]
MRKTILRITAVTAAVLFSLSPVTFHMDRVAADQAPSAVPDSLHSEQTHRAHLGKERSFRAGGHFIIGETARLLQMEPGEVIRSLRAGNTLSGLAKEKKGWSEAEYIQKLSDSASLKLDQIIKEGRLTAEEGQKLKAGLPALLKLSISTPLHGGKPSAQPSKTP